MTTRCRTLIASAAATTAVAVTLAACGGSESAGPSGQAATPTETGTARRAEATERPRGVLVRCSRRSEANFPGAFADPRNLVVGPLVLVGAAYTPASTIRDFGGNKFPLLVKAGHSVTVRLPRGVRSFAGLAYGGLGRRILPQGQKLRLRDTAHTMTFIACKPGRPSASYRPAGPSGSYADGEQVTFWSGFVRTRAPRCVPLDVWVDAQPSPRRAWLRMGVRGCP
jgi:hypothetical protein